MAPRPFETLVRGLGASAIALIACVAAAQAASSANKKPAKAVAKDVRKAEPAAREQQKELQSEQQELKQQLTRLKRQMMAAEASRGDAADALAASETAISKANRRLRELAEARGQVERQIDSLQQRGRSVTASQSREQARFALALQQQYQLTLRDPFQAFVAGENPSTLGRDAEYLGYLARASIERHDELAARRNELAELEDNSKQKREELASISDEETKNRAARVEEQARRKKAIDQLAKQIAAQRQSIDKLERDEKRLGGLINQLSRVLAEQARREAERQARAAREAQRPAPAPRTAPPASAPRPGPARESDPPAGSQFAQLRGRLPMPITGEITGRFGAPRRVEGAGTAPTWKGIFIRAPSGTGVHAVAAGQVVFADWLRGFGNLMVIDHGDDFLSVYGNNESLLRNVGDKVAVGDVVAAVGNTGGIEQTGLYFELRFQGRPFDPLKWVAAR